MGLFDASNSSAHGISNGWSNSSGNSWSNTAGIAATNQAISSANIANSLAWDKWQDAADYNAYQAQIQREWQERMANTVYQRTINDMMAAGINPILAAGMGLGTASVGSGATASMTAPQTYMANTFPEMNSASTTSAQSENSGENWSHSESGLATFLESMSGLMSGIVGAMNSSKVIDINLNGLKDIVKGTKDSSIDNTLDKIVDEIKYPTNIFKKATEKDFLRNGVKQLENTSLNHHSSGGGHSFK